MLTGESLPVDKTVGSSVAAATINTSGVLTVEATAVGDDTALSRIVQLVEDAQAGKSGAQRLADRIAAVFVPAVISIRSVADSIPATSVWASSGSSAASSALSLAS